MESHIFPTNLRRAFSRLLPVKVLGKFGGEPAVPTFLPCRPCRIVA
jgi:hypothetical protein